MLPKIYVNQTTIDMKYFLAEQVEEVFQTLWNNTSLQQLFIDSTSLTADNMATLSFSLDFNKTLRHLTLCRCDLDDHAVEQLSAGLHRNTSLHKLDLFSSPRITDTGASHIATMLAENNSLKLITRPKQVLYLRQWSPPPFQTTRA